VAKASLQAGAFSNVEDAGGCMGAHWPAQLISRGWRAGDVQLGHTCRLVGRCGCCRLRPFLPLHPGTTTTTPCNLRGADTIPPSSPAAAFRRDLMNIAMTTLSSKILTGDKEHFANLAVDAILRLKGSGNLDAIHLIKKPGGTLKVRGEGRRAPGAQLGRTGPGAAEVEWAP
jgi:hypothetical protein